MDKDNKRIIIWVTVMLVLAASIKFYIFPSWTETYALKDNQLLVVIPSQKKEKTIHEVSNTVIIRITGNSKNSCHYGNHALKMKKFASFEHTINRGVNELHEISSWITDESGVIPFPQYQAQVHGITYGISGCVRGEGIVGIIYKPEYERVHLHINANKIRDNRVYLHKPGSIPHEQKIDKEIRLLQQSIGLLFPFEMSVFGDDEQRFGEESTIEYWQHVLPNGNTVREYIVLEIIRITALVDTVKLKRHALALVKILSKKDINRHDLKRIYAHIPRLTDKNHALND